MSSPAHSIGTVYEFRRKAYDLGARTHIMGVLNVTPDSFSDGGRYLSVGDAVGRGIAMVEEGADFLDIGGESSRPGSDPISVDEELRRILPVIERLTKAVSIPISVDTYKAEVARRALEAGASLVNDISSLTMDPMMRDVVVERGEGVVLMHMRGIPKTMQERPHYDNVVAEIKSFLEKQATLARKAGIRQVIIDPGIGFGKTLEHNLEILKKLKEFCELGYPVLVGPSRKSFIGTILDLPPTQRLEGTAAAVAVSAMNGASIVRVHDVREMVRVVKIVDAIRRHA
ncbi:MAG: dihydropteroate synthase [Ignavibacteriales bacterium]|nr:dihydropteroate synthase [Ignavibacteriales bacterium]